MSGPKEERIPMSCGHGVVTVFTKVGLFVVKKQMYHLGKLIEDETVVATNIFKKISLTMGLNNLENNTFFWRTRDPESVTPFKQKAQ